MVQGDGHACSWSPCMSTPADECFPHFCAIRQQQRTLPNGIPLVPSVLPFGTAWCFMRCGCRCPMLPGSPPLRQASKPACRVWGRVWVGASLAGRRAGGAMRIGWGVLTLCRHCARRCLYYNRLSAWAPPMPPPPPCGGSISKTPS